MMNDKRPKPDDRSDNVEKLQQMVHDTIENIHASKETLENVTGEEREQIMAKNARRKQAIKGMREEIKDEYEHDRDQ